MENRLKILQSSYFASQPARRTSQNGWWSSYRHCWKWTDPAPPAFTDTLRLFTVTWNMNGREPPPSLQDVLPRGHHIYAVSTQECLRSIASSLVFPSMEAWERQLQYELGSEYSPIVSHLIGGTHLIVFVHYSVFPLVSRISKDRISTGFVNLINNKGAVAVSFAVKNTTVLIASCHFAAGHSASHRRRRDFLRVNKQLKLQQEDGQVAADSVDACVFMGDLNFRLGVSRRQADSLIEERAMARLSEKDEFTLLQQSSSVAASFREGCRQFPPTYKLDVGTSMYDSSLKQRVPAWTDRVLYKCKHGALVQESYDAVFTNKHSDHRPVFAEFSLRVQDVA